MFNKVLFLGLVLLAAVASYLGFFIFTVPFSLALLWLASTAAFFAIVIFEEIKPFTGGQNWE
jgi:hypothetical protein